MAWRSRARMGRGKARGVRTRPLWHSGIYPHAICASTSRPGAPTASTGHSWRASARSSATTAALRTPRVGTRAPRTPRARAARGRSWRRHGRGSALTQAVTGGRYARLAPADGHLALVPAQAPAQVQAMVVAGNELQQLNYGPAGHPDPRGATEEDCSSTVNYVLYRSGIRPIAEIARDNPLA